MRSVEAQVGDDPKALNQQVMELHRAREAEPLSRGEVAVYEKSFGSDHPAVATALNNLAALLQDANRLPEAEMLLRRALAIDEKSFGPEHPTAHAVS